MKKVITQEMYNFENKKEEVIFQVKSMDNRWKFTELVSEARAVSGNDEFKLTLEIAKRLFPEMIVEPVFKKEIMKDDRIWGIETQIKEFFYNDPQKLSIIVRELMGLMQR